jgi:hypothetical protein
MKRAIVSQQLWKSLQPLLPEVRGQVLFFAFRPKLTYVETPVCAGVSTSWPVRCGWSLLVRCITSPHAVISVKTSI